jgi:EAL domain-containing protein (putative c-di-GMP-specific phosphodiesterase class I)/GGDEF domain-containing protein
VKGASREAAPAVLTLGGVDLQALATGTHRALNVTEIVLEVAHPHLELAAQLLELPGAAGQSTDDPLPPSRSLIHLPDCTGHHPIPRKVVRRRDLRRSKKPILMTLMYIEDGMTDTQGSGAGSTLSDDVRRSLLELVERGLAGAQQLRMLAAEGLTQHKTKADLLGSLEQRLGTPGLAVTAGTLTNLAVINQIYGFAIGDLLQELTRATTALVLRELDPEARVAQIAGAQFVILHGATDQERVAATVRRIQHACNAVALNPHRRSVVPRVAMVSLAVPRDDGLDAAEVLKILGYSQLQSRPSHLEPVFLGRDVDHARWRASLRQRELKASRITDALRRGAVEIHFQPVVELTTGNLHNVEVLARIQTDEGIMAATEFIDSVYQLGEIVELDSQVFRRLGEVASTVAGVTGHLFVNVSPVSLLSSEFRELMSRTVQGLRAEGLGMVMVLELTEQAIVEHLDIIEELHQRHSVKFAVDDFGTGYSSIKTVSDLAASKVISHLKLDGSLVRELGHSSEAYKVVLAIANLARSLDLKVVAEHVESDAILERLQAIGVEFGQGRLFDMPLPLPGLVEEYRGRPALAAAAAARRSERLAQPLTPPVPGDAAVSIARACRELQSDSISLAQHFGRQEYPAAARAFRQLHDRVTSLHRLLDDAGLLPDLPLADQGRGSGM